jgi:hypothetical protein
MFICIYYTKYHITVALRSAPIPPCFPPGPPGASCTPRVPSGPSVVSLGPPVCPPVPLALGVSWILQWCSYSTVTAKAAAAVPPSRGVMAPLVRCLYSLAVAHA